ncbi:MAG: sn-glycerol-3-phosphate ABC transporter ATP-binding protein UgpC [Kiritimatiellae bacterium]|nr:sn-glycerol-3-phosphate ABC transporter ATP-binding protein UgpC [Kiritimatiellia bacterium]
MATVTLTGVDKVYPGTGSEKAVDNFNLDIKEGEFIVLVGPSGCGKSTTLRMVAGLEEITAGTIKIGDRVVNDVPPKDRDIAMVFQNYALYPHMTVRDNMAFGLKLRKFPKKEINVRIEEAAKILGLEDYLERRPKALSGGQRQRVAVGRAIVRKPAVFLFDEPLSNLDAKLRVQMRVEISQLHSQLGSTMIYVTHDQIEAMTMGERIVVMKDGFVQQVDDPITLYDNPVNKFVASFIGTPPMNFIEGEIVAKDDTLTFVAEGGVNLPVYDEHKVALKPYAGKKITLGIRPEDIGSPDAVGYESSPVMTSKVKVIEPMGAETILYLGVGSSSIISRVDAHLRFTVGDEIEFAVMMKKTHFFDIDTEDVII